MSVAVMTLVFSRKFGSAHRKAVALKLADWADDDGSRVFPSLKRVAAECELSERTVRRIVRQFESDDERILERVVNGGNGAGRTNHWIMNLAAIEALPETWSKADTVTALRRSAATDKADNDDTEGGHRDRQTIKEPSKNRRAHPRARRLPNGKWEIPKGSSEFDAWQERHRRLSDYKAEGQCKYCPDGGAIERRSRWPPPQ